MTSDLGSEGPDEEADAGAGAVTDAAPGLGGFGAGGVTDAAPGLGGFGAAVTDSDVAFGFGAGLTGSEAAPGVGGFGFGAGLAGSEADDEGAVDLKSCSS